MKMRLGWLLVLFVSFSLCSPLNPQWPSMFSTLIDFIAISNNSTEIFTGRWYWDETKKFDRFDWILVSSQISENIFNDYSKGISFKYSIDKKQPSKVNCTYSSIDKDMPKHDFSDFKYIKDKIIMGINLHIWEYKNISRYASYYSQVDNSFPVRLETHEDNEKIIINFFDFTKGEQDSALFNRSKVFPRVTCKPEQEKKDILKVPPISLTQEDCDAVAQCAQDSVTKCQCKAVYKNTICCGDDNDGTMGCAALIRLCFKKIAKIEIGIGVENHYNYPLARDCVSCRPSSLKECKTSDIYFYKINGQWNRDALFLSNRNLAECNPSDGYCTQIAPRPENFFAAKRYC